MNRWKGTQMYTAMKNTGKEAREGGRSLKPQSSTKEQKERGPFDHGHL